MPKISIIIPTLNRTEDLNQTIAFLFDQSIQNFELIVVDQSDRRSPLKVQDQRLIGLHHPEFRSASKARNTGLKIAKAPIVLFLDDDVIIESKDYLSAILNGFDNYDASGITGPIIPYENPVVRHDRHPLSLNQNWGWLFFPRNYAHYTRIKDGGAGNLAVIRENAIAIGGMDERFEKGAHREESDFNTRYTNKFGDYHYLPECALIHIGRRTGGVRTWDGIRSKVVKAQHHYDGAFYFLFKNIPLKHWLIHLTSLKLFFFYRKEFLRRPDWLIISIGRWMKGFYQGYQLHRKGPKYMEY